VGHHSSASGSALLDLDGFEVLAAKVVAGEWQLEVQITATVVGCQGCGMGAERHGRRTVRVRDLPIGGRPVVLAWRKRLWRCREPACGVRTWTERTAAIRPRTVLTERARAEACRRVGKDAHAVAAVARDLGVGWATIMRAVHEHGTPLVDDPARLDGVAALGLDETSFLKATRVAPTRWVTGLVDLERGRLLDVVADRTRRAVGGWLGARPRAWLARVGTVALDPWRGYASALVAPLGHATVVVDHFHAIRLANVVVDQVRRRTQQATLGHRGRKRDPLYRIRKLLLNAQEQLTQRGWVRLRAGLAAGDPGGEVAAAWQGKELLRGVYRAVGPAAARAALERFYRWCDGVQVAELSRLARTVRAREAEILAFHPSMGCSNGPTEAVNLLINKVKRVGHGFRNFGQLPAAAAVALWRQLADSPDRRAAGRLPTLGGVEPVQVLFLVDEPSTGDLTYFTITTRPSHRASRKTLGPWCRGVTDEHQSGSRRVLSRQNSLPSGSARTCHCSSPVWPMSAGRAPSLRRRSSSAS
jgi:transposase